MAGRVFANSDPWVSIDSAFNSSGTFQETGAPSLVSNLSALPDIKALEVDKVCMVEAKTLTYKKTNSYLILIFPLWTNLSGVVKPTGLVKL